MGGLPLRTPRHRRLGGPLPHRLANVTRTYQTPHNCFQSTWMPMSMLWDIRRRFRRLSPCVRQVVHALRTRSPVADNGIATISLPLDLHVLGLPLAFILSQDQTLRCISYFHFPDYPLEIDALDLFLVSVLASCTSFSLSMISLSHHNRTKSDSRNSLEKNLISQMGLQR